jgi:lipid A 3-O-deacylase
MRSIAMVFFACLGLLPLTVLAQEKKAKDSSTFTFYLENDVFTDTDREYTSGVRLTWISPDLTDYREDPQLPEWSYPIIDKLPFVNEPGFQRSVSISIGQNIYTPEDLERSDLIQDDRPYAGISYASVGFHSKNSRRMDTLGFGLGIVGPHSYADECQETVHKLIDSTVPRGWDNQLKDEPVFNIFYERKWKVVQSRFGSGLGYDMIPHIGGAFGSVFTGVNVGGQVRFGWNLPNDFGTFFISSGCDTNAPIDTRDPRFFHHHRQFGIHMFASVQGQAVARNFFLTGILSARATAWTKNLLLQGLWQA